MLTYTTKKKSKGIFMDAMDKLQAKKAANASVVAPFRPVLDSPKLPPTEVYCSAEWSKLEFNKWFADNVEGKFKIGELYTANHLPVKVGAGPQWWYEVTYLEETYNTAKFHAFVKEPLVIHSEVFPRTKPRTYRKHAPATLRPLTMEEKQLVYLQNTTPQGTA